MLGLPKFPGDEGAVVVDRAAKAPVYEYMSLNDCAQAQPGTASEAASCPHALRDCPPGTLGPYLRIWRRTMVGGLQIAPWDRIGVTCASDVAPGARPTITMADIKAQFMRTPWAKAIINTQPAGNVSLVNLPTYYQLTWTAAGFEPGEIDQSILVGVRVHIRPRLIGLTYTFGDGATAGPTTSTGGTYPTGDITHTYRAPGPFPVRVSTTFGADYSLDARTWQPIPATVTIPGPTTTVTVRQARAVLVNQ